MANLDEIAFLDAIAQAELVRNKEITPLELVEAAIERIERLNPSLNAVITPMYDLARERAAGPLEGPFAGVPFLLKDILASYGGVRMTLGAALLSGFVPDHARAGPCPHLRAGCLRSDQESVGHREDHRRVVRWFLGGCGFGHGSYGSCQRRGRVDPNSGFLLRGFRPQTYTSPQSVGPGFWGLIIRPHLRARGDPLGERQRRASGRHLGTGCRRSVLGSTAPAPVSRRSKNGPRPAQDWTFRGFPIRLQASRRLCDGSEGDSGPL
jgi:hypothetical protein